MNVVLYADDLEPITVIDLPMEAFKFFQQGQVWRVPVLDPVEFFALAPTNLDATCRIVTIWAEEFRRGNKRSWMLFTRDEEAALLLRSALLPGQVAADKETFRNGFARGFLHAIGAMCGFNG